MPQGKIKESKVRANLVIERELKVELEKVAKLQKVSFNALINEVLKNFIDSQE